MDSEDQGAPVVGFENVPENDAAEYLNNYKTHTPGITHDEMVRAYTEWATNYDKVIFKTLIMSHNLCVSSLVNKYGDPRTFVQDAIMVPRLLLDSWRPITLWRFETN